MEDGYVLMSVDELCKLISALREVVEFIDLDSSAPEE